MAPRYSIFFFATQVSKKFFSHSIVIQDIERRKVTNYETIKLMIVDFMRIFIYIFKIFRNVYAKFITPRDVTSNIASFISFQTLAPASAFILEASH